MLKDLLSSRLIQAALGGCVLIVGGSLLHFWLVKRAVDTEFPRHRPGGVEVNDRGTAQDTRGTRHPRPVDFGEAAPGLDAEDASSVSTDTAEHSPSETAAETSENTETRETDTGTADEPAEEIAVSPYGFGPYPVVPADYPSSVLWEEDDHGDLPHDVLRDLELLCRVLVKLWSEGERGFKGGILDGGKVYPHYHNTIYVQFGHAEGIGRYITRYFGGPEIPMLHPDQLYEDKLPAWIRTIEKDTAGIDAKSFLGF